MDKAKLKKALMNIIDAPIRVKYPYLCAPLLDIDDSVFATRYKLKILPQRIGIAWEEAALFFGWKRVANEHVDLVNHKKKQAVEVKSSALSDNSSSRRRKYQQLMKFKKRNPTYEVFYAAIEDVSAKDKLVYDDKIRYLSGLNALKLLFGNHWQDVETIMEQCIYKYLSDSGLEKVKCA